MKIVQILEKNRDEYLKEASTFRLYGETIEEFNEEQLRMVIGFLVKCLFSEQTRIRNHFNFCNNLRALKEGNNVLI